LSPVRAAALIGVSESTLKRWVDAGHIRAEKTAGGHRRIAATDLVAFLRARGRVVPSLEALGLLAGPRRPRSPGGSLSPVALGDLLLAIHRGTEALGRGGAGAPALRGLVEAALAGLPRPRRE